MYNLETDLQSPLQSKRRDLSACFVCLARKGCSSASPGERRQEQARREIVVGSPDTRSRALTDVVDASASGEMVLSY